MELHPVNKIGAFISIPKCASKTILTMLELGRNRDNDSDEKENRLIIYENHQRLCVLEKKYNLGGLYIFAFVKNPFDRVISWYSYHKNIEPYKNQTLEQWILDGCKTHWGLQNETDWILEKKSPLLQYNFIESSSTQIDFIGRMENFDEDIKKVISMLNLIPGERKKFVYSNIRLNTSDRDKSVLTRKCKDRLYNLLKKDFEVFGYNA